ncbi:MAG: hypothetical protein RR540_00065 [Oscillospiraceae bacterium]
MSRFKLSNKILDLKLSNNELAIFAYLCSIHSTATLLGDIVKVKQSTIAQKCCLRTSATVGRVVSRLMDKGLIQRVIRTVKADGNSGTNSYILNKPSTLGGFFFVDRHVFGRILPRQLRVYLFIAKSFDTQKNDCWNSYNDISAQLGIKRSDVVEIIGELCELNLIRKSLRKSRANKKVYVDNHYKIVLFVPHKKISGHKNRLHSPKKCSLYFFVANKVNKKLLEIQQINHSIFKSQCQVDFFVLSRGSPLNRMSVKRPKIIHRKEKRLNYVIDIYAKKYFFKNYKCAEIMLKFGKFCFFYLRI